MKNSFPTRFVPKRGMRLNMKKIMKIILIIIILISTVIIFSNTKATEELDATIKLECSDKIEAGKTITISVKLCEVNKNIDTVIAKIEYDEEIFEEIEEENIVPENKWSYPTYNQKNKSFMVEKLRRYYTR